MRMIAIAISTVFLAFNTLANEPAEVDQLRAFLAVPVSERLNEALAQGDFRPLGIWGFTLIVPGVPDTANLRAPKDVLPIPGTSDALVSEEHGRLVDAAFAYATDYNAQLRSRREK